jgi:hypothetical protein
VRSFSRGAAVAVAGLALLAVAMIAWRAATWVEPRAPRTPPTPTSSTPAYPSAEPSFNIQLPLTTTDVAVGRPVRITGTTPRQIAFTVSDSSVVTAHLDCSLCTGLVRYLADDSPTPLFSGVAPYEGDHVFTGTRGFLSLNATDRWTITLTAKSR